MRFCFPLVAVGAIAIAASAQPAQRVTAIIVSPVHTAQIVRGDDAKDHVEYDLLVVNVFPEPVTLSSVTILDPPEKHSCGSMGTSLRPPPRPSSHHRVGRHSCIGRGVGRGRSRSAAGHRAGPSHTPDCLPLKEHRTLLCSSAIWKLADQKSPLTAGRPW